MFSISIVYDFLLNLFDLSYVFLFSPEMSTSLGLTRIMLSICAILSAIEIKKESDLYLGSASTCINMPKMGVQWMPLVLWQSLDSCQVKKIINIQIFCSILLLVGFYSQINALMIYIFMYSMYYRNACTENGGHAQLRTMILLMALAPCGSALSVDCIMNGSPILGTMIEPWSIRLMQIFLGLMYFKTVTNKMQCLDWWKGKVISYAVNSGMYGRMKMETPRIICIIGAYFTLITQNMFVYLVWFKETQYYALTAVMILHLSMVPLMKLGYFPLVSICSLCIFIPPNDLHDLLTKYIQ